MLHVSTPIDSPARPDPFSDERQRARVTEAIADVERWLATVQPRRREARRALRIDRALSHPVTRDALMALTDEVLRIEAPRRSVGRLAAIASRDLRGMLAVDRLGLRAAAGLGSFEVGRWSLAGPVKRLVDRRLLRETRGVIVPATPIDYRRAVADAAADRFQCNVNVLGEAILGDAEASARCDELVARLESDDPAFGAGYVSVKISALCANLDVLAFDHSVDRISAQLRALLRAAQRRSPQGFVNLDMEEYRDLELTVAAFTAVLAEPEFDRLEAGIVLQAYLPDSYAALVRLGDWALRRRDRGGAGIKVRLVKGANLALERVEAELRGWSQAPFDDKRDSDANLKRMVEYALDPRFAGALRVGLGSHNLFDVAWTLRLAAELGQSDRLELEMLLGMAPEHARRLAAAHPVRLYVPVVAPEQLDASIAYLVRRLDENAGPENFLRAMFRLAPGTPEFEQQSARFAEAVERRHVVGTLPRRSLHRGAHVAGRSAPETFENAADTDFTNPANRAWVAEHLATPPPVRVDHLVSIGDVDRVLANAVRGRQWGDAHGRRLALLELADLVERERGTTISLLVDHVGKTVGEADPEVSEAVDALRYAAIEGHRRLETQREGTGVAALGTVVIAAPWNFPYAIPMLSLASALIAGNSVVLKPAPQAGAIGTWLVDQCRRAGVPADTVQVAACADGPLALHLVAHRSTSKVVLTGSTDTARMLLEHTPRMRLVAETSGKNAIVVTDAADIDAAIRDVVRSAFGHAGQKCSAASLVILTGAIGRDAGVLDRLADAVRSVRVGRASDTSTMMGPLIEVAGERLRRALTQLDHGERWLVESRQLDREGLLWSPAVRVGVQEGSWFHTTECFGPALGVMVADDIDHALRIQNSTGFGLTGGIHSLDGDEIEYWIQRVEVGNAYVNRHITGAIVGRQPFGGWKASSIGCGAKPGGPDHVLDFCEITDEAGAAVTLARALPAFDRAWTTRYGVTRDLAGLAAERNLHRYRPLERVLLLVGRDDESIEVARRAATLAGTPLDVAHDVDDARATLAVGRYERLRALLPVDDDLLRRAHGAGVAVVTAPITAGEAELRHWLKEQSISINAHRHGRLADPVPGIATSLR